MTPVEVGVRINNCSANNRKRLEDYFGCSVDTESPQGWFIRYSYHDVMEPYAAQNAMLREANEQIVRQYLNRVRQYSFTVRVEEEIEELLKAGESARIQAVAARLNMSSRTLQRRLEGERKQLAHDALAHTERSITEIAYTIGFSDPSNFSRTCARWFGCSPAAYRRRIRQLPT